MSCKPDDWDDGTEESGRNKAWNWEPNDEDDEQEEWEKRSDRDPDEDDWEASISNDLTRRGENDN